MESQGEKLAYGETQKNMKSKEKEEKRSVTESTRDVL